MEYSITFDFNNMMLNETGLKQDLLQKELLKIPAAHLSLMEKREDHAFRQLPLIKKEMLSQIEECGKQINEKFENFVVLGIGGSALGSKAMFRALKHLRYNELPKNRRGARFYVLDNVDPDGLEDLFDIIDVKNTMFNVVTKSGNTVEVISQFMLAVDRICAVVGKEKLSEHIIVTTDEDSGILRKISNECAFQTLTVPKKVGGRFSVLSPVGLLSAAVLNIDIKSMLRGAEEMEKRCSLPLASENPAYFYAALCTTAMQQGIFINVMMPYADSLRESAEWFCQLWAESLGKKEDNRHNIVHFGQTPVTALGVTDQHSQIQLYREGPFDKMITFIEVEEFRHTLSIPSVPIDLHDAAYLQTQSFNKLIACELKATEYAISKSGKPNMRITLKKVTPYSFGALIMFFEMATAMAGELLMIDAFNQPGVEEGKIATFALMGKKGYEKKAEEISCESEKKEGFFYTFA